jgi:hypothetical protein
LIIYLIFATAGNNLLDMACDPDVQTRSGPRLLKGCPCLGWALLKAVGCSSYLAAWWSVLDDTGEGGGDPTGASSLTSSPAKVESMEKMYVCVYIYILFLNKYIHRNDTFFI